MVHQICPMEDVKKLRDALYFACMLMLNNDKEAKRMSRSLYEHAGKLLHGGKTLEAVPENVLAFPGSGN